MCIAAACIVVSGQESERPLPADTPSRSQAAELEACREEGVRARLNGLAHGANPHMGSPLFSLPVRRAGEEFQLDRVEAWWDGWEEADRALSSGPKSDAP